LFGWLPAFAVDEEHSAVDLRDDAFQCGRRGVVGEERGRDRRNAVPENGLQTAARSCEVVADGTAARTFRHDRSEV
jgi:hypothetical protein